MQVIPRGYDYLRPTAPKLTTLGYDFASADVGVNLWFHLMRVIPSRR